MAGWDEALADIRAAAADAVEAMAQEAKRRTEALTPTDSGDLKGSFFVVADGLTAQMGTDVPYALYVHEDLKDHHDDGQAKFMESAVTGADSTRALGEAATAAARRRLG